MKGRLLVALLLGLLLVAGCDRYNLPYEQDFEDAGNWGVEEDGLQAAGVVEDGVYKFLVNADLGLFWSTAGERFADGIYEVEAVQLDGPLDNGYGMLFRVGENLESFYIFEVSGDGFVWIGRCDDTCAEETPLIRNGWFEHEAVNEGIGELNVLRVRAEAGNMIFFVNGVEVGRVTDNVLQEGDIGIMVETLGQGGVLVAFDNFTVLPLE